MPNEKREGAGKEIRLKIIHTIKLHKNSNQNNVKKVFVKKMKLNNKTETKLKTKMKKKTTEAHQAAARHRR